MQSVSVSEGDKGRPAHAIRTCGREAKPTSQECARARERATGRWESGRKHCGAGQSWVEAGTGGSPVG